MRNYQCHITINNQTSSHLRLLKHALEYGEFLEGPENDLLPKKTARAFVAAGRENLPGGSQGTVWYQVGDDANITIQISWDVPATPFTSNTVKADTSKESVGATLTGFKGSGNLENCTIRVTG